MNFSNLSSVVDFLNIDDEFPGEEESKVDSVPLQSSGKIEFLCFFVFSMICDILNCGTIAVIFHPKKIRRVNYLIVNLSVSCMMLSIVCIVYVGDRTLFLEQFKGVYICGLLSFLRNLFVAAISMTVLAISYERIKSLKSHIGQLLIKRTLLAIWGVSIVFMVPTFFTRVYVHNPPDRPKCKKVALFGIAELTEVYEAFRFTIFHVSVCAYMVFELYKIRSKMRYLYLFRAIPSQRLLKKIQRVRFVYMFSISFILVWFPTGAILSLVIIQHRQPVATKQPDLTIPVLVVIYIYLMVVPIIVLLTNEDISKFSFWKPVQSTNENEGNGNITTADQPETFAVSSCDNHGDEMHSLNLVKMDNNACGISNGNKLSGNPKDLSVIKDEHVCTIVPEILSVSAIVLPDIDVKEEKIMSGNCDNNIDVVTFV